MGVHSQLKGRKYYIAFTNLQPKVNWLQGFLRAQKWQPTWLTLHQRGNTYSKLRF